MLCASLACGDFPRHPKGRRIRAKVETLTPIVRVATRFGRVTGKPEVTGGALEATPAGLQEATSFWDRH
jgi:hypothetical protein